MVNGLRTPIRSNGALKEFGRLMLNQSIRSLVGNISYISSDMSADELRDAALELEKVSIALASALMNEAQKKRPNGPFINQKAIEFSRLARAEALIYTDDTYEYVAEHIFELFKQAPLEELITFVNEYCEKRKKLAFEIIWRAHLSFQHNKAIKNLVKHYAFLNSIPLLEDPRLSTVTRVDELESSYTISGLHLEQLDKKYSSATLKPQRPPLLSPETPGDYPKLLLENCIKKGYLEFWSPYTGKRETSSSLLGGNLFVFGEGINKFYISFQMEPLFQQPINTIFLFLPKLNRILYCKYSESNKAFPFSKNSIPRMLNKKFKSAIQNFLDISFQVQKDSKKVIITTPNLNHIGHSLWNELSVFSNLLNYNELVRLNNKPKVLLQNNFFFNKDKLADFLIRNTSLRRKDLIFSLNTEDDDSIVITLSDSRMSREFNRALILEQFGIKPLLAKPKNKIILSLRVGKRSCENEASLYISLIKKLTQTRSDLDFVIDGVNKLPEWLDHDSGDVRRLDGHYEQEKKIAELIKSSVPNPQRVTTCIFENLGNSLAHIRDSLCIISPWGAGLVKYRWLMDKSVFIYGSSVTMSTSHVHKDLYDSHLFIDSNEESVYFSGKSDFVDADRSDRESSYTIDEEHFVEEASSFIFKKLES
ncbi:hypothetical protein [uncultured Alteromonas sp.]|uniref:hypothetical protein n=1 Tax=uncultured Alteromonas sp. TaxID=179113 RepID=UPI0030EC266A